MLLVSSMCMMQIAHSVTRPPDRPATEYPTCVWSSPILHTKSSTPALILVVARHVAFTTYTSQDKKTRFSTLNNSIWVSSTKMRWIQIQTRASQLLITHINQGTNHLVSQLITSRERIITNKIMGHFIKSAKSYSSQHFLPSQYLCLDLLSTG
jgi:hypothetical protein